MNGISKKVLGLLIICGFLMVTYSANCQKQVLRHYTVADGLPGSNIYATYQDSKGYIWVCSDKGLSKFDGYSFETFTTKDGLPANDVFGVAEDSQGRIWLNTFNELVYYQGGNFFKKSLEVPQGRIIIHEIDKNDIHLISYERNKVFLLNSDDELEALPPMTESRFESFLLLGKAAKIVLSKSHIEERKKLNIGTNFFYINGEFVKDEDLNFTNFCQKKFKTKKAREAKLVGVSRIGKDSILMIFEKEMILWFDNAPHKIPISKFSTPNEKNRRIEKIGDDLLMLLTQSNTYFIDARLNIKKDFAFLSNYKVNHLAFDRSGNYWISTQSGVYFFGKNAQSVASVYLGETANNNFISALCVDEPETLWIGNGEGDLFRYSDEGVKNLSIRELKGKFIRTISKTPKTLIVGGDMLIECQKEQLSRFLNKNLDSSFGFRDYKVLERRKGTPVEAIKSSSTFKENQILVSAFNGVYHFDESRNPNLISYSRSYAAEADETGKFWIGQKDGLKAYNKGELIDLEKEGSAFQLGINDLSVDAHNNIWIATDGYGLHCYKDSNTYSIKELEGEIINSLEIDDENRIWTATNAGLAVVVLNGNDLENYEYRRFTTGHGLISNEIMATAVHEDIIYVGTRGGLNVFDYKETQKKYEQPVLYIESLEVGEKKYSEINHLELNHDENNIKINFVCLSYKSNKDITYSYQLDGVDTKWQTTNSLYKEYPTLPPGSYTFRLKAEDIDGLVTEEKQIHFEIKAPWWQTNKARLFGGLILGLLIYSFVVWRSKRIKSEAEKENEIKRKFSELELSALQAQMNPHFIFNALTAIQDFIFQKDEETANEFLVKFSRLIRLFLDSSKKKFLSLKDELEIIRHYVALEKMRFGEKFDYEIKIDETIDASNIKVPSMMIQPFVENAINHGLLHKKGKGMLSLDFYILKNVLFCKISDNGIGRKKATEIKNNSIKNHTSRGMSLVKDRQKMLNLISGLDIGINIIDLEDEAGIGIGTQVEVSMPLKK